MVLLAYKDFFFIEEEYLNQFVNKVKQDDTALLSSIIFISLVGISDPIRSESPAVVQSLIRAQINVRLFTGDNIETAVSAAQACGILDNYFVKEPNSFAAIEGEELEQIFENGGKFKFKSKRDLNPTSDFGQKVELS